MEHTNRNHIALPVFGERVAGYSYRSRPGVYAVIVDAHQRVATLHTSLGYFLPGGGIEPNETSEETLKREVREECGYEISIHRKIGEAVEYIFAANEAMNFEIHGLFFEATFAKKIKESVEDDHRLVWLAPVEAINQLRRQSQAWAVRQVTQLA